MCLGITTKCFAPQGASLVESASPLQVRRRALLPRLGFAARALADSKRETIVLHQEVLESFDESLDLARSHVS
jgi:hypothetical protein